ncbi:hypothetical protein GGS21DRAFT_368317 [Xylaria nigripes]|nr:hypothetical protein GGS21DRAFT_368317 [Xylaria nigripes]
MLRSRIWWAGWELCIFGQALSSVLRNDIIFTKYQHRMTAIAASVPVYLTLRPASDQVFPSFFILCSGSLPIGFHKEIPKAECIGSAKPSYKVKCDIRTGIIQLAEWDLQQ